MTTVVILLGIQATLLGVVICVVLKRSDRTPCDWCKHCPIRAGQFDALDDIGA